MGGTHHGGRRIGIGIVTHNRPVALARTLALTFRFTPDAYAVFVADDESGRDTPDLLQRHFRGSGLRYCRGRNMGVAWNKNRALFYLNNICKCDITILLEDDTCPLEPDWSDAWIEGAARYGHVNLAATWFGGSFGGGAGTVASPFLDLNVTAQCAAFSAEALDMVGFMDTRFTRNGYAHPEHSYRMVRAGYGGTSLHSGEIAYYLINARMGVYPEPSFAADPLMLAVNHQLYLRIRDESIHRWAWRGDFEFEQFRNEMRGVQVW